ncbi:UvrD-helicase domain-containing protein [Aminobacter niigataensis]|uniref:UvrD-helicase domain-containing protein n=1 Tax=Aminobacter niigataensis TaxID=83265 RepID=UPI0024C8B4EF|nr:ATP-dependent helicase [Aminobacter niigataensis]CAI2932760.1 putative DNA helicase [Aminobacter niigataensis]
MITLSAEQKHIIEKPLMPLCIIACAGSGKTTTAIRRVGKMATDLAGTRGRVALLSFSNIAVDTFRKEYLAQVRLGDLAASAKVDIDTMDAFIASNILRPHANRTMKASRAAYLVVGNEPFLEGYRFKAGKFPQPVAELNVAIDAGISTFFTRYQNSTTVVDTGKAVALVERLGKLGAYTHGLGRYWTHRSLVEQPAILRALVRRYPHVVVDEAQDIGNEHQAILELMIAAGCQVSLIGDPNQGIYEFAGADGGFLRSYAKRRGVVELGLTTNYRSVPSILGVANSLATRTDFCHRTAPGELSGPYYITYTKAQASQLLDTFRNALVRAKIPEAEAAIVCRARKLAGAWRGDREVPGRGATGKFAAAAVSRDCSFDYHRAFEDVVEGFQRLLTPKAGKQLADMLRSDNALQRKEMLRILWNFTREVATGLPLATLVANATWHKALTTNVRVVLDKFLSDFDLESENTIGQRLSKAGLPSESLAEDRDLASEIGPAIRVDTVHQVKGESIGGVMYVAEKDHVRELLNGTGSEVGRIGYVAVTRSRNLFLLAVPASSVSDFSVALSHRGFRNLAKPGA